MFYLAWSTLHLQLNTDFSFLYLPTYFNSVESGSGLVKDIVGGAGAPLVQGAITDASNPQVGLSFVILCFVIFGACGFSAFKNQVETKEEAHA